MKVLGGIEALLGMAPADEGLDAADLVGPEIDDGLVVQLELAGRKRLAQVVLHGAPHLHLRVHLRPEEAVGAAPVALGAVERQVGVADQLVGARAVRRADGDADAGADDDLRAVEIVGRAHGLDDAQRQHGGIRRLGDGDLQDRELVAAHARDRVRLPDQGAQALRHHLQELVAGGMAERVVHGLEVVEIEQVDRHHLAAPHAREGVLEPLVQQHAVGQIGERVVQRHVHDLGLGAALVGDVLMRDDVPAVRRLPVADVDDAPVGQLVHLGCDLAELGDELVHELVAAPT